MQGLGGILTEEQGWGAMLMDICVAGWVGHKSLASKYQL